MKSSLVTPPAKDPRELWKHFSDTYFSLRLGLAVLAFAFPFVLYGIGKWHGLDLQPSMSAYFWAATAQQCASFPTRTIFVGFLVAIGVGLYLYKGITDLENYLLNVAGICAALVAIFPERISPKEALTDPRIAGLFTTCPAIEAWAGQDTLPPIHYAAAIALFVILAIVAWTCAWKSLEYLPAEIDPAKYRRLYRGIAVAMVLFPVPGVAVAFVLGLMPNWVFFTEAAGVLTFGLYWAVKTRELSLSSLEKAPDQAVRHAHARAQKRPVSPPGPAAGPPQAR